MRSDLEADSLARPRQATVELAVATILLTTYLWPWRHSFPGDLGVCVVVFFVVAIRGHLRRKEGWRSIGARQDTFRRASFLALVFFGPFLVLSLLPVLWLREWHGTEDPWWFTIAGHVAVGLVQQYALQGFFYRRLREAIGGTWRPIVGAASIFALLHLPNPFLAPATLLLGGIACWIYSRAPNLWVLGLAHAAMTFAFTRALPYSVTFHLKVGPGFWRAWEAVQAGS